MRVVLDKATLKRHRACRAAYSSPEWDAKLQVLVYEDWDATVERLLSKPEGLEQIEWFVNHKLVPMTSDEFAALKNTQGNLP
jgi:hypothetical protein